MGPLQQKCTFWVTWLLSNWQQQILLFYCLVLYDVDFLYRDLNNKYDVNSLDFNDESRHEQLQKPNQELLLDLILNLKTSSKLTTNYWMIYHLRKLDEIEPYWIKIPLNRNDRPRLIGTVYPFFNISCAIEYPDLPINLGRSKQANRKWKII